MHTDDPPPAWTSADDIRQWLVTRIAQMLEVPADEVDSDAPIMSLALSSLEAVSLSGELEAWLGVTLSPMLVYDHPSLAGLAAYLAEA